LVSDLLFGLGKFEKYLFVESIIFIFIFCVPCVGLWWQSAPMRAQVKKSESVEARYPDIFLSDLRSAIIASRKAERPRNRFLSSGSVKFIPHLKPPIPLRKEQSPGVRSGIMMLAGGGCSVVPLVIYVY
jgi:hypothetical protein